MTGQPAVGPGSPCRCGCGQPVPGGRRTNARYVDAVHKRTAERLRDFERPRKGATKGKAGTRRRTAGNRPLWIVVTVNEEDIAVQPPEPPSPDAPAADTTVTCERDGLTVKRHPNGDVTVSRQQDYPVTLGLSADEAKWLRLAVLPIVAP